MPGRPPKDTLPMGGGDPGSPSDSTLEGGDQPAAGEASPAASAEPLDTSPQAGGESGPAAAGEASGPPAADGDAGDPRIGHIVEETLRIRRGLGRGAMGAVYEAEDIRSGERRALKVLAAKMEEAGNLEARFEREARVSGLLQHPNIVSVTACGRMADGSPYLVMELVEGPALGDLLDAGPLSPGRALLIARQALSAIGYAHSLGFVHRDLKPDNIMLARGPGGIDLVKILDFGIVKLVGELAAAEIGTETLTQTGTVFGTPTYMSPEQALSRPLDARSDLYALGCILFEMLIGRPPFSGDDALSILRKHVSGSRPTLAGAGAPAGARTEAFERLIARAIAKSPADRFAGAGDMIAAVDAAYESLPDPS